MSRVEFSNDRYKKNDPIARQATIKLYKKIEPTFTLVENPNQYGVDFLVYNKKMLVCYIESELSSKGFDKTSFQYKRIRLLPRKNHFMNWLDHSSDGLIELKRIPIFICTVSADQSKAIVYSIQKMRDQGVMQYNCQNFLDGKEIIEDMMTLDTTKCHQYTI